MWSSQLSSLSSIPFPFVVNLHRLLSGGLIRGFGSSDRPSSAKQWLLITDTWGQVTKSHQKSCPDLRVLLQLTDSKGREAHLITVSHVRRQMLVLVTCVCRPHSHTHIPDLPSPYFPFRHNCNVCKFPLSSYSFLFFPSLYTKQRFHNCLHIQMTLCFYPWCSKESTKHNNTTAFLTRFLNNERYTRVYTLTWLVIDLTTIKRISKACLLEECACVSHFCFHLLVSSQTKMTHAIFLLCNAQIQYGVERKRSWDFNLDIYFTHRAQWVCLNTGSLQ